ncbi:hypothetical protein E1B28_002955 [Marasmius oreades]|nr:uncharacterized protein E1B28_002955 [Marasmius oreades]KAG7085393.1 hypothetical protein E1B28_002955 [Marasmius oreades]
MKAIDIRSESAVKLLAEFLDMDSPYVEGLRHVNAEHFAHEVYSYLRSPYKDLFVYDDIVQYDNPPPDSPPPRRRHQRNSRWREPSLSLSPPPPEPSGLHLRSRSPSLSPPEPAGVRLRSRSHVRLPSPSLSPPPPPDRTRGKETRRSVSGVRTTSRTRSRSRSWSPSGRRYPSERERERHLNRSFSPESERNLGRRRGRGRGNRTNDSPRRYSSERDDSSFSNAHSQSRRRESGPNDIRPRSFRQLVVRGKRKERDCSDDDKHFEGHPGSISLGRPLPIPLRGSPSVVEEITESRGKFISEMNVKRASHAAASQRNSSDPTMSGNVVTRSTQSGGKSDTPGSSASASDARAPRTLKKNTDGVPRSRNRTLLDSVQAHLNINRNLNAPKGLDPKTRLGASTHSNEAVSTSTVAPDGHGHSTLPSLLLRLSDVYTGGEDTPTYDVDVTPPPSTSPRGAERESRPLPPTVTATAGAILSPSQKQMSSSIVAIETPSAPNPPGSNIHVHDDRFGQQRERTRQLRMNRSSASIMSESIIPPITDDIYREGQVHSHGSFSFFSNDTISCEPNNGSDRIIKSKISDVDNNSNIDMSDFPTLTTVPTPTPTLTLSSSRSLLLRKLEEEKRKIRIEISSVSHTHTDADADGDGDGGVNSGSGMGGSTIVSTTPVSTSTSSLDPNTMELEARLRMRARLNARLASEKRSDVA